VKRSVSWMPYAPRGGVTGIEEEEKEELYIIKAFI
jgi:hypothetical protein